MSLARYATMMVGAALAVVTAQGVLADESGDVRSLTVTVDSAETEHGVGDTGQPGLSKGDTYVSNGILRDSTNRPVGTYHVACIITDEADSDGSAWSLCSTAAVLEGQGNLFGSGITKLLQAETSSNGFGVAPPTAEFAVIGGTGTFAGAVGQAIETRDASRRVLVYSFQLPGISPPAQVPSE